MAAMAHAIANFSFPSLYEPQRLLKAGETPCDKGTKAMLSWKGVLQLHKFCCNNTSCHLWLSVAEKLACCELFAVQWQLAVEGVRPLAFLSQTEEARQAPQRAAWEAYPAKSAREKRFTAATQAEYAEGGVVKLLSTRERKRRQASGIATSSAFVVTKWKPIDTREAQLRRALWVKKAPLAAQRFFAKLRNSEEEVPNETFTPKDRLVYHFADINARSVNCPMAYDSLRDAVGNADGASWLAAIDLKDGFTGIPVASSEQDIFHVLTDGLDDMQLLRLPFGYKLAPFWFCLMSASIGKSIENWLTPREPEQKCPVKLTVYVDDILIAGHSQDLPEGKALTVVENANHMVTRWGLLPNIAKLQGPANHVTYLGIEISVSGGHVSIIIPQEKWLALTSLIDFVVEAKETKQLRMVKGAFQSLVGKLQSVSFITCEGGPRMGAIYARYKHRDFRAASAESAVTIFNRQRRAVQWFKDTLIATKAQRATSILSMRTAVKTAVARTVLAATDASGEGGIGGFHWLARQESSSGANLAAAWSTRIQGTIPGDEHVGMSTAFELMAALVALQQIAQWLAVAALSPLSKGTSRGPDMFEVGSGQDRGVTLIQLQVDNQALVTILRKLYSTRCTIINKLCVLVAAELQKHKFWLVTTWVPRERNGLADRLSHPERAPDSILINTAEHHVKAAQYNIRKGDTTAVPSIVNSNMEQHEMYQKVPVEFPIKSTSMSFIGPAGVQHGPTQNKEIAEGGRWSVVTAAAQNGQPPEVTQSPTPLIPHCTVVLRHQALTPTFSRLQVDG
jgi:hypothetical protein